MQALMGMDPNRMVIILPSALVAMYLIIRFQQILCEKANPYIGLVLPAICFIASTVLAIRPIIVADPSEYDGLITFCIRMWLTFNIATLVFLFPYYKHRKYQKALREAEAAKASEVAEAQVSDSNGD
jgi:hypothetical protein